MWSRSRRINRNKPLELNAGAEFERIIEKIRVRETRKRKILHRIGHFACQEQVAAQIGERSRERARQVGPGKTRFGKIKFIDDVVGVAFGPEKILAEIRLQ
jgi:hypothetical protein